METALVAAIILLAAIYMVRMFVKTYRPRKDSKSCGGGCGCSQSFRREGLKPKP